MAQETQIGWTYTGSIGGAFTFEMDVTAEVEVHSDGEVFVTDAAIDDHDWAKDAAGKSVKTNERRVWLKSSADAFAPALLAEIKRSFEIDQAFIEKAIDAVGGDEDERPSIGRGQLNSATRLGVARHAMQIGR